MLKGCEFIDCRADRNTETDQQIQHRLHPVRDKRDKSLAAEKLKEIPQKRENNCKNSLKKFGCIACKKHHRTP